MDSRSKKMFVMVVTALPHMAAARLAARLRGKVSNDFIYVDLKTLFILKSISNHL
jgi:hypothetical protein